MRGRGTVLGGRYTLTERIGGGGMGAVWRADDGVLARQVAVKILHPALLEDGTFAARFRREAQLLAALKHPGIVHVHDYGESDEGSEDPVAYIVMELIDGRPLDKALTEGGPMPAERALGLLARALDALHAAHRQDIVHRDIKPSNLMLRGDDQVTVTDFGIARAMASTRLTASHAVVGTALYMAPEQAEGAATTPASDLYSIGVVCYELLTGEPPFTGESVLEVALKHIREPAPDLPDGLPAAVRDFVATALAKKPADRFEDAAAMAAAARAAVGAAIGAAIGAPPVASAPAPAAASGGSPATPATALVPPAASVPPAAPEAPATPAGEVGKVEPRAVTEPGPRRRRRGFLVPIVIPVIITAGTASVLLIEHTPATSAPPGAVPSVVLTAAAGTDAGVPQPTAQPPAPGTTQPTSPPAGTPATGAATAPAAGSQPVSTAPNAGGGAGAVGQGASPRGGSATPAPAKSQAPPATTPGAPAAATPVPAATPAATPAAGTQPAPVTTAPPQPVTPPGCGGTNWGYIVNVGDGLKVGLAKDSLAGGQAVVMGGATAYGWVHSVPSSWHHFNPCNLSGPDLVQETDGRVTLSGGFSYLTNWSVTSASTPGAYYLKDYMGYNCLTDNGAGNQLTMLTCTPGNKSQEWRIP